MGKIIRIQFGKGSNLVHSDGPHGEEKAEIQSGEDVEMTERVRQFTREHLERTFGQDQVQSFGKKEVESLSAAFIRKLGDNIYVGIVRSILGSFSPNKESTRIYLQGIISLSRQEIINILKVGISKNDILVHPTYYWLLCQKIDPK